ncbi:YqbF domain-containing protein [Bacillus paranthracis]
MYYVKLIKGQSFYAFNHRFLMSEEEEVSEKVYNYLRRNEFFEVRKEEYWPKYKSTKKNIIYL